MRNELHKFIKETAAGDNTKFMSKFVIGENRLLEEFSALLGFKRYHTCYMRPDNDPKWTPFMWGVPRENSLVSDVRVMTFNYFSASCFREAVSEDTCFPNGWNARELVDTLMSMRTAYKQGALRMLDDGLWGPVEFECTSSDYSKCQLVTKYLLRLLYGIVCRHGAGIKIGAHHIDQIGRIKTAEAVKKISETAIVLYAHSDQIVYVGDQVDIPGVHHEKYKSALIIDRGRPAVVYGNDMQIYGLPSLKLRIEEYNTNIGHGTPEERIAKAQEGYNKRINRIKKSLFDYIAITKEDIEKEIAEFDFGDIDSKPNSSFNMV